MGFVIATFWEFMFFLMRAHKHPLLYALLGGAVGVGSVMAIFAYCYYELDWHMSAVLDITLAIVGCVIVTIVDRYFKWALLQSKRNSGNGNACNSEKNSN